MDLGSLFLVLSVLLITAVFIARPLIRSAHPLTRGLLTSQEQVVSTLQAERDRLLDAIQELDFDFKLGKIPESDYPAQRTALLQKGTDLLKQLDEAEGRLQADRPASDPELEAAVAARRRERVLQEGKRQVFHPDDEVESLIAVRRRGLQDRPSGFCPQCGHAVQQGDRFCSHCGAAQT